MIYAGYTPKKSSDEQYTPAYAVAPIIKYIPGNKIVWCPFDTEHSEYVLALKAAGIRVVHSHILTGEDFFVYEPEEWDLIVSNPPFSIKQKVVERCLALGKPFALLLSYPCPFIKGFINFLMSSAIRLSSYLERFRFSNTICLGRTSQQK